MNTLSKSTKILFLSLLFIIFMTSAVCANEPGQIDTGNTTFVFISAALVMIMVPGLFLLYAGLVRRKNA